MKSLTAVEAASKAVNQAQDNYQEAAIFLKEASEQLDYAMQSRSIDNSKSIQQIHEAQNAVGQAINAVQQIETNPDVAKTSIKQAVRACDHIQPTN